MWTYEYYLLETNINIENILVLEKSFILLHSIGWTLHSKDMSFRALRYLIRIFFLKNIEYNLSNLVNY